MKIIIADVQSILLSGGSLKTEGGERGKHDESYKLIHYSHGGKETLSSAGLFGSGTSAYPSATDRSMT